jgi:hypothetical protein
MKSLATQGPVAIIRVMRKIFISHESVAKREAVKLKELLLQRILLLAAIAGRTPALDQSGPGSHAAGNQQTVLKGAA